MTTPDKSGLVEDVGSIEIFGIPFSTFTRSITMGLEEMGLNGHYLQHHTPPHSEEVKKRNPLGLLPVFIHRPDALYTKAENAIVLFESNAIRRYLDELIQPMVGKRDPRSSHQLTPALPHTSHPNLLGQMVEIRSKVDQWISLASSTLFQAVEFGVVKPRLAMESNKADDATIHTALEGNIDKMHTTLEKVEKMANVEAGSNRWDYLTGKEVSWADLFLYPPLADLRAIKEGEVVKGPNAKFPWLAGWLDRMEKKTSARNTFEGTLASQRE